MVEMLGGSTLTFAFSNTVQPYQLFPTDSYIFRNAYRKQARLETRICDSTTFIIGFARLWQLASGPPLLI